VDYKQEALSNLLRLQELWWQVDANCIGEDPDLFFPDRGASTRKAKELCNSCVAQEHCLEYSIVNNEKFGIWGGLSERERRKIRKERGLTRKRKDAK
tara:strand:- start:11706 stop:11996 length:291 start_codon:yes stop_codon:yes gene_type:complete